MFIPIKEEFQISEAESEKFYWNKLVWDTHKWIEHHKGYYTCAFCNATFTNMMPIDDNVKLCKDNPIINKRM